MKRESDAPETPISAGGPSQQHIEGADPVPMAFASVSTSIAPLPLPGLPPAQENQLTNGVALAAESAHIILPGAFATTTTVDTSATHSTEPTDSRTPSLHIQTTTTTNTNTTSTESGTVSTSPTSSPLTDLNLDHDLESPKQAQAQVQQPEANITAAVIGIKEEYPPQPQPLRTPRQRKQIDRFSTTIFEPQSQSQHPSHPFHTSPTSKVATASPTFAKPASATRRKSSAPSRSGSHPHSRAASLSAASPRGSVGRRASSEVGGKEGKDEVEDESLRLARELSGAEFGLRRRVGSGSG